MLDITLQNFETDLIAASAQRPVLLDIWAPWCGPCKTLGPVLEKLEVAYEGRFALAKLNADEQPEIAGQLSQMFGTRSVPLCVLFKDGQPVDGFIGALAESKVRAFLDKHVPSAAETSADESAAEAESLLAEGDLDAALERLQEALAINPGSDGARYDYVRALLGAGRVAEARGVYDSAGSRAASDARLAACGHWLSACERRGRTREQLADAVAADKRDFVARFELAQVHFAEQRFTESMDELLEILMRDKSWNDGLARKTYVAILEIMKRPARAAPDQAAPAGTLELAGLPKLQTADPIVDSYRRRLSMVVF
jgi:putative thioredoxin